MAELLPIQCKCASSSGVPGGTGPTCGKNPVTGQPYKCLFFVTTPKAGGSQGNGYIIRSNYDCGGSLSCTSTKCVQVGCSLSIGQYCAEWGEGKVCPNLCGFWGSTNTQDGGYNCVRWGRKMCSNEKCPTTKEAPPVPPRSSPPPPGCTKTCTNGFKLNNVSCTCDCNDASHPCPAGQRPRVVGTTEPKSCVCMAPDGTSPVPPPSTDYGDIVKFLNDNYLIVGGVVAAGIFVSLFLKK